MLPSYTRFFGLAMILLVFTLSPQRVLGKVIGTMMVAKGEVWVVNSKGKKKKGKIGFKIRAKDQITTAKDSRAKLVMLDKNVISISPESQVSLEKYEFDKKKGKKDVLLNVLYGKIRSNVKQKYDGDKNKFQVKTKAAVAGVRGTDFLSSYNRSTGKSRFVTFEGLVEVGQIAPGRRILNAVQVAPGQMTVAQVGQPPSAPRNVSRRALAEMDKDSTPAVDSDGGEKNERVPAGSDGQDPPSGNEVEPNGQEGPAEGGELPPGEGRSPDSVGSGSSMIEDTDLPMAPEAQDINTDSSMGANLGIDIEMPRDPCVANPEACNDSYRPPRLEEKCPTCRDQPQRRKARIIIEVGG